MTQPTTPLEAITPPAGPAGALRMSAAPTAMKVVPLDGDSLASYLHQADRAVRRRRGVAVVSGPVLFGLGLVVEFLLRSFFHMPPSWSALVTLALPLMAVAIPVTLLFNPTGAVARAAQDHAIPLPRAKLFFRRFWWWRLVNQVRTLGRFGRDKAIRAYVARYVEAHPDASGVPREDASPSVPPA